MVNAASYAKPPQIQDKEEYPGLPLGIPAGNKFGMSTGGRPISYSSALQQRPPVHQVHFIRSRLCIGEEMIHLPLTHVVDIGIVF